MPIPRLTPSSRKCAVAKTLAYDSAVSSIRIASLQARKEEAARSTQHGHAFEDQLGLVIAAEAQRLNDPYVPTGCTAGAIKNCKTGDFVSILGPDSAAPNARVVWEAKEDKSYDLRRALSEIEEARKNRQAQVGVFVFSRNTAPNTLQSFARYGSDLVTTLLHGKRVEHLRGALERDPRSLLPDGERRQKYRNQTILSPGKSIAGMSGDLQHELPVTAFVEQTPHIRSLHRQTAEDKRPR